MPNKLIEKLKSKQNGLSDYAFAEKLGVSQQLWQMTRTGKREIGITILEAISRAYSELALDVLIFLGFDVSMLTATAEKGTTAPETHQNKILSRFKVWLDVCIMRVKKIWQNSHEP